MIRKSFYEVMKKCPKKNINDKILFLDDHLKTISKCPEYEHGILKNSLNTFKFQFKKKWIRSIYKKGRFLKNNEQWRNSTLNLSTWTLKSIGRPSKDFNKLPSPTKRHKTKTLREDIPLDKLTYTAQMRKRAVRYSDVSKIIKYISITPGKARTYRTNLVSSQNDIVKTHTPLQALSIFCGS